MTLRFTTSVIALAAAGLLFGASAATAAPRNVEVRGDGTCNAGLTDVTGITRGAGLGRADYAAAITEGAAAYGSCNEATGTVTYTRAGDDLVTDVTGVVCDVGLSGAGTAVVANRVFEGAYAVDGAASGGRYAGNTGVGNTLVGCYGDGTAAQHANGSLARP